MNTVRNGIKIITKDYYWKEYENNNFFGIFCTVQWCKDGFRQVSVLQTIHHYSTILHTEKLHVLILEIGADKNVIAWINLTRYQFLCIIFIRT